jgi:hypothetical protein
LPVGAADQFDFVAAKLPPARPTSRKSRAPKKYFPEVFQADFADQVASQK